MQVLKLVPVLLVALVPLLAGCGDTATIIEDVETDTFLSTADSANHSDSAALHISKSASLEERAIVKLPTGEHDSDDNLDTALDDPRTWFVLPFLVLVKIFEDLLNCHGATLTSADLQSSVLRLDATSGSAPAAGAVQLQVLAKPWWQAATWNNAHFFSRDGRWTTPGGDVDPTWAAVTNAAPSGTTMEFDLKTYVKALLDKVETAPIHYGLLLSSASPTMTQALFHSAQSASTSSGPRLVSVYNCPTTTGYETRKTTFLLGRDAR